MQNQSYEKIQLQYRHYNLPLEFPTAAFLGNNWLLSEGPVSTMHFHNCMEIGYCYSGSGTIYVEQKKLAFQEGDISIIPENTIHISCCDQGVISKWEYILFDPSLMFPHEPFSHLTEHSRFLYDEPGISNLVSGSGHPQMVSIIRQILEELHVQNANYQDSLKGLFLAFISQYLRCSPVLNTKPEEKIKKSLTIRPAIQHIRAHFAEKITVPQLAELCSLSEPHFRRIFEAVIHLSPFDYLHHLRIRQACYLLIYNDLSISEIAQRTGFTTLSSFNRQFQMVTGTSPRKWKNENKNYITPNQIISLSAENTQGFFMT